MKHFYLIGALLCASQALSAQNKPEVQFLDTPWAVVGISQNDRWITGGRQYAEIYRYNTETKQIEYIYPSAEVPDGSSAQEVGSIMNDGTIVGVDDYGYPSILHTVEKGWEHLPVPDNFYEEGQTSSAGSSTGDGKYIIGFLNLVPGDTPYHLYPALWTLNDKGSYEVSKLPEPETDFLGEKFQYTSPRSISEDGKRVLGVIVNRKGDNPMGIVWTKDAAGQWTYDMPILNIKYNLDRYREIHEQEPDYNSIVTKKAGETGYAAQVKEFINIEAEWRYKLYSEGETGKDFSATPIMSRNGLYMAGMGADFKYDLVTNEKGYKEVQTTGDTFPAYLNLETGEYTEIKSVPDMDIVGISNDADIVTTDNYDIYLILSNDRSQKISIAQWLKDKYDMDLGEILPSNLVANKKPRISGDGKIIAGVYTTQTDEGELDVQQTYCIKLPEAVTAIMNTLNTPSDASISVSNGQLVFSSNATDIHVFDMTGTEVLRQAEGSYTLGVGQLGKGVYVAKAKIGGKTVTSKFYLN